MEQGIVVSGIAYDKNVARISILGVSGCSGSSAKVFGCLPMRKSTWILSYKVAGKKGKRISPLRRALDRETQKGTWKDSVVERALS